MDQHQIERIEKIVTESYGRPHPAMMDHLITKMTNPKNKSDLDMLDVVTMVLWEHYAGGDTAKATAERIVMSLKSRDQIEREVAEALNGFSPLVGMGALKSVLLSLLSDHFHLDSPELSKAELVTHIHTTTSLPHGEARDVVSVVTDRLLQS